MNMCRVFDHTPSRKIRSPSGLISKKTISCDQVGVPDLKANGRLTSDPFCKAKALNNQFCSVLPKKILLPIQHH